MFKGYPIQGMVFNQQIVSSHVPSYLSNTAVILRAL